ncbi:MAG: hypothetical protein RIS47_1413 [Bacteroidota bacterium]|jgi:nicotinamidase-related amidase
MRILKENVVAVCIDMQDKLLPHIYQNENLLTRCITLFSGIQTLGIPTLVTQQYTKGLGMTHPDIQNVFAGFNYLEKRAFSCCQGTDFMANMLATRRQFALIAGIESHICVLQTAIDLLEQGFTPVIVEDCVGSRNENDKQIAIQRLRAEGAYITTTESILFELLRDSTAPEFKTISNLIK